MIMPHPETNLKLNILVLAGDILKILSKAKSPILLDSAIDKFLTNERDRTPEQFFDSITFLYTLGAVELEGYRIRLTKVEVN